MFLDIMVALLVPPLGVFMKEGFNKDFFINLVLTFLGYLPGMVHAIYVLSRKS